jgi:Ca-activated chloride channel family protein
VNLFRFEHPWVLLLLAAVVVGVAVNAARHRAGGGGVLFSSIALLPADDSWRARFRWLLVPLRAVAAALLIVALARPQTGHAAVENVVEGIDVVASIDTSTSMEDADFGGKTKMEASKQVFYDFVGRLENDRVGIVIFAGEATVLSPLTLDREAAQRVVSPIRTGMLPDGTAIGMGMATGVNVLRDSSAKSKVLILLTDGENNAGTIDPDDAAELARTLDIRVYTIGALEPIDPDSAVYSTVDEDLMRELAEITGGRYYRASDSDTLSAVLDEIRRLERTELAVRREPDYAEANLWFLVPGVALLLVELLLAATVLRRAP